MAGRERGRVHAAHKGYVEGLGADRGRGGAGQGKRQLGAVQAGLAVQGGRVGGAVGEVRGGGAELSGLGRGRVGDVAAVGEGTVAEGGGVLLGGRGRGGGSGGRRPPGGQAGRLRPLMAARFVGSSTNAAVNSIRG
jgi:hypothetical protein